MFSKCTVGDRGVVMVVGGWVRIVVGNGLVPIFMLTTLVSYDRPPIGRRNPHPMGLTRIASLGLIRGSFDNIMSPSRFDSLTFGVSKPLVSLGISRKRGIHAKRIITRVSPRSFG